MLIEEIPDGVYIDPQIERLNIEPIIETVSSSEYADDAQEETPSNLETSELQEHLEETASQDFNNNDAPKITLGPPPSQQSRSVYIADILGMLGTRTTPDVDLPQVMSEPDILQVKKTELPAVVRPSVKINVGDIISGFEHASLSKTTQVKSQIVPIPRSNQIGIVLWLLGGLALGFGVSLVTSLWKNHSVRKKLGERKFGKRVHARRWDLE